MLNFFKKKDRPAPPEEAPSILDEPDPELEAAALAAGSDDDVTDEDAFERDWSRRARAVIPGGASTGSKRAAALWGEGVEHHGPTHFVGARGCEVTTIGERQFIDCTMALGSVALGYGDPGVTDAARRALASGHSSGLSSVLEVTVAERLCEVIPCAERVRFLKTGAEATAAAVRIARAATGRSKVVGAGYFGWLDWCSAGAGVPDGVRADFAAVPFGDADALSAAVRRAGADLACIVLEPVVERLPPAEWLMLARSLCDATGALLVFDEVKTGFRVATGGWQEKGGVVPDLASFGKAMANGFPLAAVVGRAAPMDEAFARGTWISSTLASEAIALAAADAVLDRHAAEDVCAELAAIGAEMRGGAAAAIATSGIDGVSVEGIDPMWFFRFDQAGDESRFLARALAHGVMFKRGAYNFAALPHRPLLADIEAAASQAFVELMEEGGADDAEPDA
jgi:glutamate-1-semialdehyde aminotransferase